MLLRIIKKQLSTLLLLSLYLISPVEAADISTEAKMIHIATEQRTLAQEMMKNYVLTGLGVRARRATQNQLEALARFDQNQKLLSTNVTNAGLLQQLQVMENIWTALRKEYTKKPDRTRLEEIYNLSQDLLHNGNILLDDMESARLSKGAEI